MHGEQSLQSSATNRPCSLISSSSYLDHPSLGVWLLAAGYWLLEEQVTSRSGQQPNRLTTSAQGPHPFPFRTRQLSPAAPMVLPLRDGGRVGRRQPHLRSPGITDLRASGFCLRQTERT